jgi:hypothetical protein
VLNAYAGDPIVVHAMVAPGSEQSHAFSLGGIPWATDWREPGSNALTADGLGPWETADAFLMGGAGGPSHMTGDLFYGDLRRPFTEAGMWGLQRVLPADGSQGCPVLLLSGLTCAGQPPAAPVAAPVTAVAPGAAPTTTTTSGKKTAPAVTAPAPIVADTVTVTSATYVQSTQTWQVLGTVTPATGQTITVHFGAAATDVTIGAAQADTTGAWLVVLSGAPQALQPAAGQVLTVTSSQGAVVQGVVNVVP